MRGILFDILEVNIAASIIIILICLLERKLRKYYGAGWLRVVWLLLAVRLLIPYNFSLPFTELRFLNEPGFEQEEKDSQIVVQDVKMAKKDAKIVAPMQLIDETNVLLNTEKALGVIPNNQNAMPGELYTEYDSQNTTEKLHVLPTTQVEKQPLAYSTILAYIWILGVGASTFYLVSSNIRFYSNCQKTLQPILEGTLLEHISNLQMRFIGKVKLPVYESATVSSPMLIGILSPKLVWPMDKQDWEEKELELVVAHELCHYKNKDLWLKLLMMMAWCLNWFNPLVLLMKRKCFFHIELACDGCVLEGSNREVRAEYAGMLVSFTGKKQKMYAFSTSFGGDKKRMKQRIDYVLDTRTRKKGILSLVLLGVAMMVMCLMISCGYKPGEVESEGAESTLTPTMDSIISQPPIEENLSSIAVEVGDDFEPGYLFSYNHEYNERIRYFEENVYLAKADGIYRILKGSQEEELLFANEYQYRRGMELYQNFLYFCGSAQRGEQLGATIYRMDLETLEVVDVLAMFSCTFEALHAISVYEEGLYVSDYTGEKIGFKLNKDGLVIGSLDENTEDFLYREYNAYVNLKMEARYETEYDSPQYWDLIGQSTEKYCAVIDVAACMKMLEGQQVLEKYKDEAMNSLYLKQGNDTYEYLCDVAYAYASLVTEMGVYYAADLSGSIFYVDYITKTPKMIVDAARDGSELWLVNYDRDYVYYTESAALGDEEAGDCLMRIPRFGGESQVVYQFENGFNASGLYQDCAVVEDYLYYDGGRVPLNLSEQKAQDAFSDLAEEAPAKDEVLSMRLKALEGMSEAEIERLTENVKVANLRMENAYFYDYLFERLADADNMYWNYFEQKGEIQIGETEEDGPIMVYNRFDADNFISLMEEMRDSLKNDLLKADFDILIENTKLAKETHDVEYVEQIYRILHDMDYFLLRYGPEDVGQYTDDNSTVSKYYGVLEIYKEGF